MPAPSRRSRLNSGGQGHALTLGRPSQAAADLAAGLGGKASAPCASRGPLARPAALVGTGAAEFVRRCVCTVYKRLYGCGCACPHVYCMCTSTSWGGYQGSPCLLGHRPRGEIHALLPEATFALGTMCPAPPGGTLALRVPSSRTPPGLPGGSLLAGGAREGSGTITRLRPGPAQPSPRTAWGREGEGVSLPAP